MVLVMIRPARLDITESEEDAIYDMLRARGGMSSEAVAAEMHLDEAEVALYLANQTGLGYLDYRLGSYFVWHWL